MASLTTRTPNGLTNAAPGQTMADAGMLDPTWYYDDTDDFMCYAAGFYTATVVGTGAITQTALDGGAVLLSTSAGAADAVYAQRVVASHKLIAGKDTFFKFRGILSDVLADVFYCGLLSTSATPLSAPDGVYLLKATGQAALSLVSKIGGVTTTVALPASNLLVNAVAFELGIHIKPNGDIAAYFNPSTGQSTTARGPVARLFQPALTQVLLSPSFGLLNSAAAIKTLTVDYFVAASQR
jgi:hypothetical protein